MVGDGTVLHEACGRIVPVTPGFCMLCGGAFNDDIIAKDVVVAVSQPLFDFDLVGDEDEYDGAYV